MEVEEVEVEEVVEGEVVMEAKGAFDWCTLRYLMSKSS